MSIVTDAREVAARAPVAPFAALGGPAAVLLAGPPSTAGPEVLRGYRARVGDPADLSPGAVLGEIRTSGLRGRGGGGFPLWRKLQTALDSAEASGNRPMLVVNCSESEPASRKDWTLCSYRPHTVLDGAAAVAKALGSRQAVVHLHGESVRPRMALRQAVAERVTEHDPRWRISLGPGGYVAGEASAVVRFVHSGVGLPLFSSVPLARSGPTGHPTVVINAETAAHVAAALNLGASRWRAGGSPSHPGPHLVTLAGAVDLPGQVLELVGPATIGDLLTWAGIVSPPRAVLVGGYAGSWVRGEVAWSLPMEPGALREAGASYGCGLIGVVPHGECVVRETAWLVRYLASESAGQCGPCVHGLPVLADCVEALATGSATRRTMRRLHRCIDALPGSGACSHPDGVVGLVTSALEAFGDDVAKHRNGKPCAERRAAGTFPLPGSRMAP